MTCNQRRQGRNMTWACLRWTSYQLLWSFSCKQYHDWIHIFLSIHLPELWHLDNIARKCKLGTGTVLSIIAEWRNGIGHSIAEDLRAPESVWKSPESLQSNPLMDVGYQQCWRDLESVKTTLRHLFLKFIMDTKIMDWTRWTRW